MKPLNYYKYLIFDCDGVILDSNRIKTEAFGEVVSKYGVEASKRLIKYHQDKGGISRYKKFEYFLSKIAVDLDLKKNISLNDLVKKYSIQVKNKLENCPISKDIIEYRKCSESKWIVVSGSDQKELKEVFIKRNIQKIFDGGIFGSPSSKDEIFKNILNIYKIQKNEAIYFGDSKYDYIAATKADIDFVFLKKWSEFKELDEFAKLNLITVKSDFSDLLT